jgi:anaerobic C4-dicarboxylate transporter
MDRYRSGVDLVGLVDSVGVVAVLLVAAALAFRFVSLAYDTTMRERDRLTGVPLHTFHRHARRCERLRWAKNLSMGSLILLVIAAVSSTINALYGDASSLSMVRAITLSLVLAIAALVMLVGEKRPPDRGVATVRTEARSWLGHFLT